MFKNCSNPEAVCWILGYDVSTFFISKLPELPAYVLFIILVKRIIKINSLIFLVLLFEFCLIEFIFGMNDAYLNEFAGILNFNGALKDSYKLFIFKI